MQILRSTSPRWELRPYVRAYAQRVFDKSDSTVSEYVPAQLEQVLNFELGTPPGVRHRQCDVSGVLAWIGGAQTSFPGFMDLFPGVESFAVFFQPTGWSLLFRIPMCEITNRIADATSMIGCCMRTLWNRLGEATTFEDRVLIVEEFLSERALRAAQQDRITAFATDLFRQRGTVSVATLAGLNSLGVRQLEREFQRRIGTSPKVFARVARFQAALDAKLAAPDRTWLDIAHYFGYYDQMHMVHDFKKLGRSTPTELIAQLGDVRPPALSLASAE